MSVLAILLSLTFSWADESCQDLRVGFTDRTWYRTHYREGVKNAAKNLGYSVDWDLIDSAKDLPKFEAVISPGGHDIHPKYYTQRLTTEEREKIFKLYDQYGERDWFGRDTKEWTLLHEYFSNPKLSDTPYLGICYGMEFLAIYAGAVMIVDLKIQYDIENRRDLYDEVQLTEKSQLRAHTGEQKTLRGYKYHHQGIDPEFLKRYPVTDFKVTGTSHDGKIIEVIEFLSRPAMGVQFHPEQSSEDPVLANAPFYWLLEKACQNRKENKQKSL